MHAGDRRRFTRIPVEHRARLAGPGGEHEVQLLDISMRGVLVDLPASVPLNPAAPYLLQITLSPECRIQMELTLIHRRDDHAGFHCHHIDLDSAAHLRRLVELHLGDSRLLERELGELMAG